jgi:hypothetical protein
MPHPLDRQRDSAKQKPSLAAIVILIGLEACEEPFKTPSSLNIRPRIVCRVSYFDDVLDRSVSCRSSFHNNGLLEQERTFQTMPPRLTRTEETSISEAPRRRLLRDFSRASTLLEDLQELDRHPLFLRQTNPSYKLGRRERPSRKLRSKNRYLSQTGRCMSPSSMSSLSQQSLGSTSESSTRDTYRSSLGSSSRRKASPSSSITSSSRRSPLSTVRYVKQYTLIMYWRADTCLDRSVENPDVVIEANFHICPAGRGSSTRESSVLRHAVDASGLSPVPTAHINSWRRRASAMVRPLELRRQTVQSRSIQERMGTKASVVPHNISTTSNDKVIGEKFMGAVIKENGSQESTLEAHSRVIEEAIHEAVLKRLQDEQQRREQAIQDQIAAAEALHLQELRIQEDENQLSLATVCSVGKSNEHSQSFLNSISIAVAYAIDHRKEIGATGIE